MADPRFASLKTDPRFRRSKQKNLKVEIDERFKDVLESEEFGGKGPGRAKVDKRGRAVAPSNHADQIKRFYRLKSPEADEEKEGFVDYARGGGALESSGSEDEGGEDSEVEEDELVLGVKRPNRLPSYSPSDSEDESDDDHLHIDLSEDEAHSAFPPEADDIPDDESEAEPVDPSKRIAAVNLDWDNMQASDLFAVFNSFLSRPANKGEAKAPSALGKLLNVKIYPSEFGKERMAKEETEGPGGGIFKSDKRKKDVKKARAVTTREESGDEDEKEQGEGEDGSDDAESDEEFDSDQGESDGDDYDGPDPVSNAHKREEIDGLEIISDVESDAASNAGSEDINMDQLRQYQLERLRYYYAIATFSTVAASEYIMNECNGTEFEQTANLLDLSYVPEDMTFDEDSVHDEADKEPKGYKGNDFVTDALRHSNVKLTWDQDDPNRVKMTRRTLTREEIEEQDFKNLVAFSGSEAEESDLEDENDAAGKKRVDKKKAMKERKEKLRNLLLIGGDDDDGAVDVWGKAGTALEKEFEDIRTSSSKDTVGGAKKPKSKASDDLEITFRPGLSTAPGVEEDNLTSLERYKLRMKEKKQRKKEKMELKAAARDGSGDEGKNGGKDAFFGSDSEGDDSEEERPRTAADSKLKPKPKSKDLEPTVHEEDDLSGLVGSNEPDTNFSMKDIVKSEKESGSKRKRRRTKKGEEREKELGQEGWKIDVKDDRFKALHEEPEFAIDPSNPHFVKTKAMQDLLDERTRRRNMQKHSEPEGRKSASGVKNVEDKERNLDSLVESVKRKMDQGQQKAKRKRSRK
ncbi:hypothetical protein L202_03650 [Cryptococcus amylolentus CBS 6039]|uniref:Uncharacterized protein n=1 Tax=Cryptococcus amylolentus CBS 6039 TaxID=1295533 RepID=A0A1E3HTU0_9TREE|nr:hypothetical protein L202_03650 [Cryptococcus amylolentus CBS 6039]ODN79732.1 hypothetical protein L202_03650 [Cryptococcus amylolentus CBS 6039]